MGTPGEMRLVDLEGSGGNFNVKHPFKHDRDLLFLSSFPAGSTWEAIETAEA